MTIQAWWAFTLVSSVAIICPGPANSLAVSNALHFRFNTVVSQTLGNLFGLAIMSSLVIFCIVQLSELSNEAMSALQYAGAIYILVIGVRYVLLQRAAKTKQWGAMSCGNKCSRVAFLEGLLIAVANPQTMLFFFSLFPNFINVNASIGPQFLLLVPSILAISFLSMMSYGLAAHFGKRRFVAFLDPQVISSYMGYCLILFGVGLLLMQVHAI